MEMVGNDVVVRRWRESDRERLVELVNNKNVVQYLANRVPYPYTLKDADEWIALTKTETRPCNFAVEWQGDLAGCIGLDPLGDVYSGTAEIGYWLGEPYWGNGIMTRAVRLVTKYAFDELLFVRLQAGVFSINPASMRVLEKNGYIREGVLRKHVRKFGVIHDYVLYAALRSEWGQG